MEKWLFVRYVKTINRRKPLIENIDIQIIPGDHDRLQIQSWI